MLFERRKIQAQMKIHLSQMKMLFNWKKIQAQMKESLYDKSNHDDFESNRKKASFVAEKRLTKKNS